MNEEVLVVAREGAQWIYGYSNKGATNPAACRGRRNTAEGRTAALLKANHPKSTPSWGQLSYTVTTAALGHLLLEEVAR